MLTLPDGIHTVKLFMCAGHLADVCRHCRGGQSDPYVVIKIDDEEVAR
jgi:hypothetical protein